MIKGIQLLLLTSIFSFSAFGITPESLMRKCISEKGTKLQQSSKPEYTVGNKTCVEMRCAGATEGSGGLTPDDVNANQPDGAGGGIFAYQEVCKDKTDWVAEFNTQFEVNTTGNNGTNGNSGTNGNTGVSINNDGGFYVDGVLVSEADWRSACLVYYTRASRRGQVKRIRKKCRRGGGGGNISINTGGNTSGPRGGGYVILQRGDGTRFNCTYTSSWEECQGREGGVIVSTHPYEHCVNCGGASVRGGGSVVGDILGAVLPPLAQFGSAWLWSDAYRDSNQAWAGAAQVGFEQCQLSQTNHMHTLYGNPNRDTTIQGSGGFFADNELPHEYISPPGCNGYQLGGFAGGGGFQGNGLGGFGNPWGAAGYSPGFQLGVQGPYGQYNPYGQVNGMGGYPGGGLGINVGLGMGGGFGGGFPGGGYGGGFPGGGYGGYGGGFPGGGYGGGFPGGGLGLNIGLGGGLGGGFGGGYPGYGGGFGTPGFNGGIGLNGGFGNSGYGGYGNGGIYGNGGAFGNGTVPWGNGTGGYFNGSGGFNGGGFNGGGYNGGNANFGNIQQSYAMNQQALGQDAYYQQAALQNSYNQAGQNAYMQGQGQGGIYGQYGGYGANGGYGYAPYNPGNIGLGMNLGFGFGF
jgi:hypothetical protein